MMMNKIFLLTLFLLFVRLSFGQEGVYFESLTFEQALAKARSEKKFVFMDCYTSWCGPCKYMAERIFPTKEAGDYFNPRFVCVKYDMEKGEGPELSKKFGIKNYPTFLIIHPDGSVRHRIVGGGGLDAFVKKVEQGMIRKTSLGYLENKYEHGKLNKKETMLYLEALNVAYYHEKASLVRKELEARLNDKDKVQREFWPLIQDQEYGSEAFLFVLDHLPSYRKNMGKEIVDNFLNTKFNVIINQCKYGRGEEARKSIFVVRQQLSRIGLEEEESLLTKVRFAEACINEDIDRVIAMADSLLHAGLTKDEIWSGLSPFSQWVKDKATKEQLDRIVNMGKRLISDVLNEKLKKELQFFFEPFEILSCKEVYFHDLTFDEALQKARSYNKMLFIDCYTGWCGPCMYMANVIFKEERMADFLNKHFICVKYDMESNEGMEIQKKYHVQAYPTFIMLNPDGSLRHQFVGGGETDVFIPKVEAGLNDATALGIYQLKYEQGCRDKKFLMDYIKILTEAYLPQASNVAMDLFVQLNDMEKISPDFWFIVGDINIAPWGSEIEEYVYTHREKYFQTMGKDKVNARLLNGYMKNVMMNLRSCTVLDQKAIQDLDEISQLVATLKLNNNDVYQAYIKMARARKKGDIDHFITICEQVYNEKLDKRIIYNMGGIGNDVTPKQRERWNSFLKRVK